MKIGYPATYTFSFYLPDSRDAKRTGFGQSTQASQEQQLTSAQEDLQRLRSTPGGMNSARQDLMSKVGWLRQQLDALKAMLLRASPQQAKALAQELRGIASQLASIAKELGGGGCGQAVPTAPVATDATAAAPAPSEGVAGNVSPEASPSAAASTDDAADGESADSAGTTGQSSQKIPGQGASLGRSEDALLRRALAEAKQQLTKAAHMLKPKLAAAGKEAKSDMHAIDKSLREIDGSLQQGLLATSYSGQGALVFDLGSVAMSGLNINLMA